MKKWLCKMTGHIFGMQMVPSHLSTLEDGKKKLWVVMACTRCRILIKIGLAHECDADENTKVSEIPDGWKFL